MKMSQIIEELRQLGYKVTARKRVDGGYLITSINGSKFSASHGNTFARSLIGTKADLSSARQNQISYNINKYIKGYKKPKDKFDDALKMRVKEIQRQFRKYNVKTKGRVTMRKARYYFKSEGREATIRYLDRLERYAQGYAYPENVEYLAQYEERVALSVNDTDAKSQLEEQSNYIRGLQYFKEEWISKIYELLYSITNANYDGAFAEQKVQEIYSIIY